MLHERFLNKSSHHPWSKNEYYSNTNAIGEQKISINVTQKLKTIQSLGVGRI